MSSYNNFEKMSNDERLQQPKSFAKMTQPERDVTYREFMKKNPFEDLEKKRDLKTTATPIPNCFTPPTFVKTDVDGWKAFLEKEGYVVIKDMIDGPQIEELFDQFKKDWTDVSPKFDFGDKTTWGIENTPMMYNKGVAVFTGFGNSELMWKLRLNSDIQSLFKHIHRTDDLVVSLDGFSVFLSSKQKSNPWLHVDQHPTNPIYSVQGAYNFNAVSADDAGFVVVPGSHNTFVPPPTKTNKDWIIVDPEAFGKVAVKLCIPENCFTFWNSKLIHANTGITKKKKTPEFNRLTAYIAYLPKTLRDDATRKQRIQAYLDSQTTSHWANKCQIKRYPWGFGPRFETRGFIPLKASLTDDGKIPEERLKLL